MDIPPSKAQQELFELYYKDKRKNDADVQHGELIMKVWISLVFISLSG